MVELSQRKTALFSAILQEYVETAKPISSKALVEKYGFEVSPATVRNDMQELEELGLITHPHTSAGRIPTETGYRYYVEHYLERDRPLQSNVSHTFQAVWEVVETEQPERQIKTLAKAVAEVAQQAVLVSFNPYSFYYTGITNVFSQPEFSDPLVMQSFGVLIDHLDEVMTNLQPTSSRDIDILIGTDNPISARCSILVTDYQISDGVVGAVVVLGPLRMNYQLNYQILKYIKDLLINQSPTHD
ncbi:MAG: DeoR family transcriptional regulator [Candidatus Kerfeldbacteria bacterium]|nr:DeoR family transcriptional regulator [Candidatus Kerfeldbacteria bacterium]